MNLNNSVRNLLAVSNLTSKILTIFEIKFVRDTIILQTGNVISMATTITTSLVLARILESKGYGIYSLIFSLFGLLNLLFYFGASPATVTRLSELYVRKDSKEIKKLFAYFFKVQIIGTIFALTIGIIIAQILSIHIYHSNQIGKLVSLLLLLLPFGILYFFVVSVFHGMRNMKGLTIIESFRLVITSAFVIVFVVFGFGVSGAVYGHVLSMLIFSIISLLLYQGLYKNSNNLLPSIINIFKHIWYVKIKKYLTFGILISLNERIITAVGLLPILIAGIFVEANEVGYLKVAISAITVPLSVLVLVPISRNLASMLPYLKEKGDLNKLRNNFIKVSLYAGIISICCTSLFVLITPFFIKYLYGYEYLSSVNLIYVLAIYVGLSGFGVGLEPFFRAIRRMGLLIKINFLILLILMPIGFILIKSKGTLGAVVFITSWYVFTILTGFVFALRVKLLGTGH